MGITPAWATHQRPACISKLPSISKEKPMTTPSAVDAVAQTPSGINHLVLNVRNLENAHWFWTECLGFKHVGALRRPGNDGTPRPRMHFYSGEQGGKLRHHDIALVERASLPGERMDHAQTFNHVAIAYPTREAWEQQIGFLNARGVRLYDRVDRGVTQSIHLADPDGNTIELVYELPREQWEGDIEAALNRAVMRPVGAQGLGA
jgi:catechol 2,3-dioxygenase